MKDKVVSQQGGAAVSGISGFHLKMIAVIAMFIDHLAAAILEKTLNGSIMVSFITDANRVSWTRIYLLMRIVGRMSFPIYCFLLVEGFLYTRNRYKYAFRLFVFALLSEIPFDLALNGVWRDTKNNNVFFTLLLGLFAIMALDLINRKLKLTDASKSWGHWFGAHFLKCMAMAVITLGTMSIAELVLCTDYGASGVAAIVLIYVLHRYPKLGFTGAILILALMSSVIELAALFMLFPIDLYNGTRGKQRKYFFYLFYPAHLLLLAGIRYLMGG